MNHAGSGRLALAALLASVLAACAPDPVKESPGQAPAPVARTGTPAAVRPAVAARPVTAKPVAASPLSVPGSMLAKRSVFYPLDNYAVAPEYQPMLKAHAGYLREHPGASIAIEGNCDERGSREYNLALGQRRADGVGKMMVLLGASAKQIETVSLGEERPKAAGHDESSWTQNRRSDIVYRKEQ